MPPKENKKSQKQIDRENAQSLQWYVYVSCGATGVFAAVSFLLYTATWYTYVALVLTCLVHAACLKFMQHMVAGGMDLAMDGGMAEHAKDVLLVTGGVEVASLLSQYFWLAWLVVPARAFYMLWTNILGPWFFAPAPPEPDEKQQRRMEKKMRRQQNYR